MSILSKEQFKELMKEHIKLCKIERGIYVTWGKFWSTLVIIITLAIGANAWLATWTVENIKNLCVVTSELKTRVDKK